MHVYKALLSIRHPKGIGLFNSATRRIAWWGAVFAGLCAVSVSGAPVSLSLWSPVQSSSTADSIAGVRINLVYGHNRSLAGLDIGLVNAIDDHLAGLQVGLIGNKVGLLGHPSSDVDMKTHGAQVALLANAAHSVDGLQLGGFGNWCQGTMRGVQIGVLANLVENDLQGMQLAGVNWVRNRVRGIQLAPAMITALNLSSETCGSQVSIGILSLNRTRYLKGLQLNVGLIGNSVEEGHGAQIALLCNMAASMRGVQIGLVNWCRTLHGVQIGAMNIITSSVLPVSPLVNAYF